MTPHDSPPPADVPVGRPGSAPLWQVCSLLRAFAAVLTVVGLVASLPGLLLT